MPLGPVTTASGLHFRLCLHLFEAHANQLRERLDHDQAEGRRRREPASASRSEHTDAGGLTNLVALLTAFLEI